MTEKKRVRKKDPARWLTIYFPEPELRTWLQRKAADRGVSMGEVVRRILDEQRRSE